MLQYFCAQNVIETMIVKWKIFTIIIDYFVIMGISIFLIAVVNINTEIITMFQ